MSENVRVTVTIPYYIYQFLMRDKVRFEKRSLAQLIVEILGRHVDRNANKREFDID